VRTPALLLVGLAACSTVGEPGETAKPTPDDYVPPAVQREPPEAGAGLAMIAPPFDVASTAAAIDAWPRIIPGVHARAITSFDRGGGNDDGFGGTYSTLYVENGEHVIFDERGPGVLRTLWFTSGVSGDAPLAIGRVSFYFDDETTPRIRLDANDLFAGKTGPFSKPLVAANLETSGGFASWAPLPYKKRLRIATERAVRFYQVHYDELPADWDVATFRTGSTDEALATRFATGASTLRLEETALDVTKTGSGVIDVLRFVPNAQPTDDALRAARIKIWFDGATDPQVDAPLGFFFGSGLGLANVSSIAWTMQPLLFESRMPMPFWESAHIAIIGLAGKLHVHVGEQTWKREEAGTFEVHFREERPAELGKDFVYADVTGSGKLVATVLGVDPLLASTKGWWEGDLRTHVDGARTPSVHGTGHEDDHLGGWSNEFLSRPFSLPMQGSPRTDLYDTGTEFQLNGASTMYRLWPGLAFYGRIRHSTEHGAQNNRAIPYAAATFIYRTRARRVMTDGFDVRDGAAHGYEALGHTERVLTSAFEGESTTPLTATVHAYTGAVRFTLAIDPDNDGVELRRLFDHAEAPARNAIEVDGVPVTSIATWGPYDTSRAWTERDVFIPAQLTRGKSKITVRWVPQEKQSNAARFEAWTIER
jgi:hypothetical protein